MLPWNLEDWLTEVGDRVVRKVAAANSVDVLGESERLLYEFWLFDTEQRNGGVSQYFGNRGLKQWDELTRCATPRLPSFPEFAAIVNEAVGRARDPYQAILNSTIDLDASYGQHQLLLVRELREAVTRPQ